MKLSIDVVPGSNPPLFRWQQEIDTVIGKRNVEHEGVLPLTVEVAVVKLINMVKRLERENLVMRGSLNMTVDRLGGEVEGKPTHEGNFLQRVDELRRIEETMTTRQANTVPQVSVKGTKGKG